MEFFDYFVQALGFIGIAFNILSVQFNTHGKIMFMKTLGEFMFVVHYIFLGAWTGVAMDAIGMLRNIIFTSNVKKGKSNKLAITIFSIITILLGVLTLIFTWDKMIEGTSWLFKSTLMMTVSAVVCSILSILAKFLTTVGYGIKNPHTIRKMNFPSSACWLVYNGIYFSISGVLNEIFVMTSIIIAEIRFRKDKDNVKKSEPEIE